MIYNKTNVMENIAVEFGFKQDNYYSASASMHAKNKGGDVAAATVGQ